MDDPKLELRIPISPRDSDMRMVRYLLESIQQFGGPIARAAHCVLSVSAEGAPRDLRREFPWTTDYSIEFHWVDPDVFERWVYDGTGSDRFWIESDADVVAMLDSDLLVAGNFDDIVIEAHREQRMHGFLAHVSPFGFRRCGNISSGDMWRKIYKAAGLSEPSLNWQYTGWGLDFAKMLGRPNVQIISNDPNHRFCPPYLNAGVVVGPKRYFDQMGETFNDDYEAVLKVFESIYTWQIAHCVELDRHKIPFEAIPINFNFPMNLPAEEMRSVNPDPSGKNRNEDIKIFHYIGRRGFFESPQTVQKLIEKKGLTGAWPAFQDKLKIIYKMIDE